MNKQTHKLYRSIEIDSPKTTMHPIYVPIYPDVVVCLLLSLRVEYGTLCNGQYLCSISLYLYSLFELTLYVP